MVLILYSAFRFRRFFFVAAFRKQAAAPKAEPKKRTRAAAKAEAKNEPKKRARGKQPGE